MPCKLKSILSKPEISSCLTLKSDGLSLPTLTAKTGTQSIKHKTQIKNTIAILLKQTCITINKTQPTIKISQQIDNQQTYNYHYP